MGIAEFLDKNALAALVGVIIVTAGIVGGLVRWWAARENAEIKAAAERKLDLARSEHAQAISDIRAEATALKVKLAESDSRFAGIERRLGDDRPVIDLGRILVPPDAALTLGPGYEPLGGGLYLRLPTGSGWTYDRITENTAVREMVTIAGTPPGGLLELGDTALVHRWQHEDCHTAATPSSYAPDAAMVEWRLRPRIILQQITRADIRLALIQELVRAMAQSAGQQPDETSLVADPDNVRLLDVLQANFPYVLLVNQMRQMLAMQVTTPNVENIFNGVSSAGRVLYVSQRQLLGTGPERITVFQEWFIISGGGDAWFARITIPTRDGKSHAKAWTNQWLAGLKIVEG